MLQTFSTECFIVQTVFSDRERAGKGLKSPESLIVSGGAWKLGHLAGKSPWHVLAIYRSREIANETAAIVLAA